MNFENLIQVCFSSLENKKLNLLQIGANNGIQDDPFRESIIKYQINSYLLEPIPEYYNMLIHNYAEYNWVKCYNIAITNEDGENEMLYVPPVSYLPEWTRGLGTFDTSKNFLGGMSGLGTEQNDYQLTEDHSQTDFYKAIKNIAKTVTVKTNTLNTFLNTINLSHIDIYASDTEGFDWVVFNQLDLNKFSPKIIFMETHTLGSEQNSLINNKLIKHGYTILEKNRDTVKDTIAIKK